MSQGQAPGARAGVSWEYKSIIQVATNQPDSAFNYLGQEGWELAAVASRDQNNLMYVLKRPKRR